MLFFLPAVEASELLYNRIPSTVYRCSSSQYVLYQANGANCALNTIVSILKVSSDVDIIGYDGCNEGCEK